jgi:hypothetical protein
MIIFFIRRFNDVDHLTPIIYKLRKETESEVLVLCTNPTYDIKNDVRLKFLREKYDIVVKYAYEAHLPNIAHRILSYFVCDKYNFPSNATVSIWNFLLGLFFKLYKKVLYNFIYDKFVKNNYFGEKWAIGLFEKYQASILIFDFVKNRQYITMSLVNAAKKLKIPTMAIPPGAMLYNDRLGPLKSFKDYDLPDYDYLIMQHEIRRDVTVKIGGPAEKMYLLGTARFCREWHEILLKIIPTGISEKITQTGKLNVLYIERPISDGVDKKSLVEMIKAVSELDFIHFLIKPHTRSNHLNFEEVKMYGEVVVDIDSVELIRWADVVIGTTSSILLEVLCQNKTLLYPKFISGNTMLFEKMNACWQVNSLDELVSALVKIGSNPEYRPYSDKNVENLITKIVYSGDYKRDVLNEYKNFILAREKSWTTNTNTSVL